MSDDHVAAAVDAGLLQSCEEEHGTLYYTPGQDCPVCAALADARDDADRARQKAREQSRRAATAEAEAERAREEARQAARDADDLAWRRKLGHLLPWER